MGLLLAVAVLLSAAAAWELAGARGEAGVARLRRRLDRMDARVPAKGVMAAKVLAAITAIPVAALPLPSPRDVSARWS